MKEYCRKNGLALLEGGKVVVARDQNEIEVLQELYKRGERNGAKVELVDEKSLKEIEPYARTHKQALYSYNTAVVNPKEILDCLCKELMLSNKVSILTNTEMVGIKENNNVITNSGSIKFQNFINAAGAYSDKVAHSFGVGLRYKLIPFKGTYKKLIHEKSSIVRGSIYPVPNIKNPFLGVHLTKGIDGDVYIGPTAIPALGRENYGVLAGLDNEAVDILYREAVLFIKNPKFRRVALEEPRKYWFRYFFKDVQSLVNGLAPDDIEGTSKVGIRPQLVDWKSKELIMDFVVLEDGNSIHILNAISPAFTCSMAFAEYVVDKYLS